MSQSIEAVFENGVFRPLQPLQLPEHLRVTLLLPGSANGALADEEDMNEEVGYQPLPLEQCRTIRVKLRNIGALAAVPYPVEDEADALGEWEQP